MLRVRMLAVSGILTAFALAVFSSAGGAEQQQKPKIAPICKQCHTPDEKTLFGTFAGVSPQAGTIQIQVGPAAWLVKYDDATKLKGTEKYSTIPKEKEVQIAFTEREGSLYATSVAIKPPARLPEEKLIKVDELSKLVDMGLEKGNFFLVDSRPMPRYLEGHIPGAISIYDAEFDKNIEKLPKEKDKLLIFYCGGVT